MPHRWSLRRCRIEVACELLRSTDEAVTEVAFRCGFESSQYFSTVFRKHTGVSPSGYRQEVRPAGERE